MVGTASFLVGLLVMVQSVPSSSNPYPFPATPHEDDAKKDTTTTTTTSPVLRTALSSFSRPSANTTIEQEDLLIDDVFPKGHLRHEYYDTHYEEEDEVGTISASNDDLTIYEGVGLARVFSKVYKKRIWNGHILYDVADNDDDESDSNTRRHQLRGRSL